MSSAQREYMAKHNVPQLMDVIIRMLLEQRPDDPYVFIVSQLRREKTMRMHNRSLTDSMEK